MGVLRSKFMKFNRPKSKIEFGLLLVVLRSLYLPGYYSSSSLRFGFMLKTAVFTWRTTLAVVLPIIK